MKTLLLSLTYAVGVGELILAGYFIRTHSANAVRRAMAILSAVTGLWVISTAAASYNTTAMGLTWYRASHVFGLFVVTSLFCFALLFPIARRAIDRLHYLFIYSVPVVFSVIVMSSTVFLAGFSATVTNSGSWYGGSLYWLYSLYLLLMYAATVIVLVSKYRAIDGTLRSNLVAVLWSVILGGFPAVVTDVLFPLFTNEGRFAIVGSLSTVAWLGMTSYIVLKK